MSDIATTWSRIQV